MTGPGVGVAVSVDAVKAFLAQVTGRDGGADEAEADAPRSTGTPEFV
jgi:hypothetical protein